MELTAQLIANHVHGEVVGDPEIRVKSVAKIEQGKPGNICFFANPKYEKYVYTCQASVLLLNRDYELKEPVSPTIIRVDNAYEAVAAVLALVNSLKSSRRRGWRFRFNTVSWSSRVGKGCYIGEYAWVGKKARIGKNTQIYPSCYIGDRVQIGENCILYPGVRIYEGCKIGGSEGAYGCCKVEFLSFIGPKAGEHFLPASSAPILIVVQLGRDVNVPVWESSPKSVKPFW